MTDVDVKQDYSGTNFDDQSQQQNNQQYDDNDQDEDGNDQADDNGDGDGGDGNNYADDDDDQQDDQNDGGPDGPKYVRLRGLPWSATHQEILDFLKDVTVIDGAKGIHLITSRWDGKNTGEAYVEVQSAQDVEEALKLNKASMGHRYIEVFTANPREAREMMRKSGSHGVSYVVKLRGLPYAVTEQQIEEFFNGLEIKADREGILFVMDRRGRATGEAFVQFESQEDTEQALGRNREKIGHRYIEIFRSSLAELKRASGGGGRPGPYDIKERGGNRGFNDFGGGRGNMRGGGNDDFTSDWGSNSGGGGGGGGGGGVGGFGIGANNTLGFNNLPGLMNSGNFGNGFGGNNNGGGGGFGFGGGGGGGNFGNNGGGGGFGGNNRFNNNGNGNFGNDFGDFGNFGNNRQFGNNSGGGGNFGGGGGGGNFGGNAGGNFGGGGGGGGGNFGNFGNNGGGGVGGFNNVGGGGGGNFGPIGGGRGDAEYFTIHMRGLPYSAFENEVFKFLDPVRPANVRINYNNKGMHAGTADVFFETYEDAQLAMKKHREQIGSRYIELFFDGKTKGGVPNTNFGGGGGGGGGGAGFRSRI